MIISFILCGFVFIYVVVGGGSAFGSSLIAWFRLRLIAWFRICETNALGSAFHALGSAFGSSALGSAFVKQMLIYTIFAIRFASVFFAKM